MCSEIYQHIPQKSVISSTISPAMKVGVKGNHDFNHKRITFVLYAIVYNGTINDMGKGAYQPKHLVNQMIMEVIIS